MVEHFSCFDKVAARNYMYLSPLYLLDYTLHIEMAV